MINVQGISGKWANKLNCQWLMATHFSKTALSQDSQKMKILNVILPKSWNYSCWRCKFTGFLELRIRERCLCIYKQLSMSNCTICELIGSAR